MIHGARFEVPGHRQRASELSARATVMFRAFEIPGMLYRSGKHRLLERKKDAEMFRRMLFQGFYIGSLEAITAHSFASGHDSNVPRD